MLRLTTVVVLSLFLIACGANKRPAWVNDPSSEYSHQEYLSAVGEGDSMSVANQRAVAGIARIFEVVLQESSLDFTKISTKADKKSGKMQSHTEKMQQFERKLQTEINQVLQGVTVVKSWQEQQGRWHYSLAVLNKREAARRFRRVVTDLDGQIVGQMRFAAQRAHSNITRLAAMQRALNLQQQLQAANSNLSIVSKPRISSYNIRQIEEAISTTLASMRVKVVTPNRNLTANLQRAVHGLGVQQVTEDYQYLLEAHLELADAHFKQGWFWQHGAFDLMLKENGRTLATRRQSIKVSATSEDLLQKRLNDYLASGMTKNIYGLFLSSQ